MEKIFYGDWKLLMDDPQQQSIYMNGNSRLRIVGSDNADGVYYYGNDYSIDIKGKQWKTFVDFQIDLNVNWEGVDFLESFEYASNGLWIYLNTDDGNSNRLFLNAQFKSLDPKLNPIYPIGQPFDFTFPEKW